MLRLTQARHHTASTKRISWRHNGASESSHVVMGTTLRSPLRHLLSWLPFVAAFAVLFWPTLAWMAERFDAPDSFYSHGWLIPPSAAWLAWQRRDTLSRLTPRSSFWGLALLVPSTIIHVLASWWQVHFVSGFAMVASLWGLTWTCWGWSAVVALRFPLLFLLFMVPLPEVLLLSLSFQMKLLATTLATYLLHAVGVPALQEGSLIRMPGINVMVDDTCSGLRSLMSLVALATLWTAFMPACAAGAAGRPSAGRWRKLVMVASAVPIAVAANMVRIAFLSLIGLAFGLQAAEGFIHYGSGMVVFGIAFLALALLSRLLQR